MTRDELSKALGARRRQGRRSRFGAELRQHAVEYCRQRRSAGGTTWQTLEQELGVSSKTLMLWVKQAPRAAFHAVQIQRVDLAPRREDFVVHGPCGVRVEGLDVRAVAELIRRLV